MSSPILDRESANNNGFHGDPRVVIEELDDELTQDGEREFGEDDEQQQPTPPD